MSDRPLRDTLLDMTAASVERAGLPDREVMLVRIAALAAVGAPPSSYLLNLGVAREMGLTLEDVQGVLVAIAPVTGGPRVVEATGAILQALGFAIRLLEEEEALEAAE
jgi:alkylhydroperoxidase/carboxymuconolactone decarboxylase family protein YurZ